MLSQRTIQRVALKIPADPLDAWLNRLDSNMSPSLCAGAELMPSDRKIASDGTRDARLD